MYISTVYYINNVTFIYKYIISVFFKKNKETNNVYIISANSIKGEVKKKT